MKIVPLFSWSTNHFSEMSEIKKNNTHAAIKSNDIMLRQAVCCNTVWCYFLVWNCTAADLRSDTRLVTVLQSKSDIVKTLKGMFLQLNTE